MTAGHASGRTRRSRSRGPPHPRSGVPRTGRSLPTTMSRPVTPSLAVASVEHREHGDTDGHDPGPESCGSAATRSIRSPAASSPDHARVGQPHRGTAVTPGCPSARPGPTRRTSVTGSPATERRGQRPPAADVGHVVGHRPGIERHGGQVAGPEHGPRREVASGDEDVDPRGRRRGHGVQPRGDRHRGEHGGQRRRRRSTARRTDVSSRRRRSRVACMPDARRSSGAAGAPSTGVAAGWARGLDKLATSRPAAD